MITQTTFRDAVLDAGKPIPPQLRDAQGTPAGARFSVYRNNVIVSLSEALATGFPLVQKLLGEQTFARLAGVFVRRHPPNSPLMMYFGEQLPGFLESFAPLSHIGYLPDCARLDLALRRSYHAADSVALDPERLQGAPEDVMALQIPPAPATIVLRSPWPLYDIWRFNMVTDAPKPKPVAQDVLITRPEFDPILHLLPAGGADWFDALHNGRNLAEASEAAAQTTAEFDLARCLTQALETKALTDPKKEDS